MLCDKVLKRDGSLVKGVEVHLEWGITDRMHNGARKSQTRCLYVHTLSGGVDKYTQNWQPEVNKLLEQIKTLISPLMVDQPRKDDLNRLPNVKGQWIEKVPLEEALARARDRHASAQGMTAAQALLRAVRKRASVQAASASYDKHGALDEAIHSRA